MTMMMTIMMMAMMMMTQLLWESKAGDDSSRWSRWDRCTISNRHQPLSELLCYNLFILYHTIFVSLYSTTIFIIFVTLYPTILYHCILSFFPKRETPLDAACNTFNGIRAVICISHIFQSDFLHFPIRFLLSSIQISHIFHSDFSHLPIRFLISYIQILS